ncbi:MAG TPA: thioesterase domain-containing protein, partial [Ktedonobacteraceae bacterium]|nr:thioesterase domain-containing protein [Ktedonobacteraceae bacterium]
YVVPGQGQHVTMAQMRQHLKVHLPEYMIPADFIVLESLPLTPNGKLDRQALPTPESARRTVGENYVAPKLMIHHQLIAIWEELLNRQPIGITDNFFHVGGHSLLAARLVGRIEQIFGKKIALSTLFAGPTIEQLAQAIQQRIDADEGSSRAAIIAVQMGKAGQRPFFYLHGDYMGGAFYCFTLARGLGAEQPFYALEPYKFNGLRIPPTIKEIAAAHIEALRAIQPKGPYLLGGFCNGGLMAYEMARQLRAAGESLDMLLLIDPASPPHSRTRRAYTRICDMFGVGEDTQIDWQLRLRHIYKYLRFPLYRKGQQDTEGVETAQTTKDVANAKGHRLPRLRKLFPDPEMLRQDWPGVYRWEASGYRPGTYDGKITFVWSSEDKFRKAWIRTMPPVQVDKVFVIPGSHLIYTLEQVNALAQRLRACLDVANKGQ